MPDVDLTRLVLVDETWASTNMHRTRGRSSSGVRLVMAVPHGHWKTTTFVAGLRAEGGVGRRKRPGGAGEASPGPGF